MNQPETGIARRYLKETRYRRRTMQGPSLAYPRAPLYKEYPEAGQRLRLDPEAGRRGADLWQCLARRRSQRRYLDRPLTRVELAGLLWATQGITGAMGGYHFRAAPSAGALYPVETYLAVHRVEEMTPGIWHFQVLDFALELIAAGDFRQPLVAAGLAQDFLGPSRGGVYLDRHPEPGPVEIPGAGGALSVPGRRPPLPKPDAGRHRPGPGGLPGGGLLRRGGGEPGPGGRSPGGGPVSGRSGTAGLRRMAGPGLSEQLRPLPRPLPLARRGRGGAGDNRLSDSSCVLIQS
jgi:hypothetical protein